MKRAAKRARGAYDQRGGRGQKALLPQTEKGALPPAPAEKLCGDERPSQSEKAGVGGVSAQE